MAALGPAGGWSVKDHLYHRAIWQQVQLARMQRRPEWAVIDLDEATYRAALTSAEDFRDTFAQLLAELDRWSYADLLTPVRPDGPTVLKQLSGDSYEHDDEHRRMIRRRLGAEC